MASKLVFFVNDDQQQYETGFTISEEPGGVPQFLNTIRQNPQAFGDAVAAFMEANDTGSDLTNVRLVRVQETGLDQQIWP